MDNNPYFVAAERGDLLGIRALLDADRAQSVNASDVLNIRDGLFSRWFVCMSPPLDVPDVESTDELPSGDTPIHLAARGNRLEVIEVLLMHGASKEKRNKGSAGRAVAEVQKSREQNGGFYEPGPPEAVNGHTS
eukprot:gene2834-3633_t